MKKEVINRLETVAKDLPVVYESKPVVLPREEAIKHYKNLPKKGKLQQMMPVPVNHLSRLKKAYKSGGEVAVGKYVGEIHRKATEQKRQIAAPAKVVNTI